MDSCYEFEERCLHKINSRNDRTKGKHNERESQKSEKKTKGKKREVVYCKTSLPSRKDHSQSSDKTNQELNSSSGLFLTELHCETSALAATLTLHSYSALTRPASTDFRIFAGRTEGNSVQLFQVEASEKIFQTLDSENGASSHLGSCVRFRTEQRCVGHPVVVGALANVAVVQLRLLGAKHLQFYVVDFSYGERKFVDAALDLEVVVKKIPPVSPPGPVVGEINGTHHSNMFPSFLEQLVEACLSPARKLILLRLPQGSLSTRGSAKMTVFQLIDAPGDNVRVLAHFPDRRFLSPIFHPLKSDVLITTLIDEFCQKITITAYRNLLMATGGFDGVKAESHSLRVRGSLVGCPEDHVTFFERETLLHSSSVVTRRGNVMALCTVSTTYRNSVLHLRIFFFNVKEKFSPIIASSGQQFCSLFKWNLGTVKPEAFLNNTIGLYVSDCDREVYMTMRNPSPTTIVFKRTKLEKTNIKLNKFGDCKNLDRDGAATSCDTEETRDEKTCNQISENKLCHADSDNKVKQPILSHDKTELEEVRIKLDQEMKTVVINKDIVSQNDLSHEIQLKGLSLTEQSKPYFVCDEGKGKEIKIFSLKIPETFPPSLSSLSRSIILKHSSLLKIKYLPLPQRLKWYCVYNIHGYL